MSAAYDKWLADIAAMEAKGWTRDFDLKTGAFYDGRTQSEVAQDPAYQRVPGYENMLMKPPAEVAPTAPTIGGGGGGAPSIPTLPPIPKPEIFKSNVQTGAETGGDFQLFKGSALQDKSGSGADQLRIGGAANITGARDIKKKKQTNTLGLNTGLGIGLMI